MDTESGRVYEPEEYRDRKARRIEDRHQAEFELRRAQGKIVEVSETVARQVQAGQRVEDRHRKRRAAKAARRRNR